MWDWRRLCEGILTLDLAGIGEAVFLWLFGELLLQLGNELLNVGLGVRFFGALSLYVGAAAKTVRREEGILQF